MPNKKNNLKTNAERCLPKPVSTLIPKSHQKTEVYIPWNEYDEKAATLIAEAVPADIKRPKLIIPYLLYVSIKHIIALKRQSFQQYILSLLLQDLNKHVAQGWLIPVF